MNQDTILNICNDVATQIRFDQLETVVGNSDKNAKFLLLAVTNGMYRDVYRYYPWSWIRREAQIDVYDKNPETALPGDFGYYVDNTCQRIDGLGKSVIGPYPAAEWQDLIYNSADAWSHPPTNVNFAIWEKKVHVFPTPVLPDGVSTYPLFSFIYMNDSVIQEADSPYFISKFESDGDKPNFDADLVEAAGLYRALRMLGLGYADEKAELGMLLKKEAARDGSRAPSSLVGPPRYKILKANTTGYTRTRGI